MFAAETWVLMGIVAVACVLGCLHALASYYREHTRLHDLRIRIIDLRREYAERLAKLRSVVDVGEEEEESVGEAEVIEPAPAVKKAA